MSGFALAALSRPELDTTAHGRALKRADALWAELNRTPRLRAKRRARLAKLHARAWKRFVTLGARSLVEGR